MRATIRDTPQAHTYIFNECRVNGNRNQRKNIFDILGIVNIRGAIIDVTPQPVSANTHTVLVVTRYQPSLKALRYNGARINANNALANPNLIYGGQVIKLPNSTKKVNPYPVPSHNISRGAMGNDVKWLQWELVNRGYDIGQCWD